jgi:hypothetical protein
VLQSMKRDPSESQAERFLEVFGDLFAPRILTPRQAKLVANSIRFAIGLLPGELDIADQMLLECARVTYPDLYSAIQRNYHLLIPDWDDPSGTNTAALPAGGAAGRLEAFVKPLPHDHTFHPERLRQGLRAWFPKLNGIESEDEWQREQRLCSEEYFWRYFALHIPPDDYPDGKLRELLRLLPLAPTASGLPSDDPAAALSNHLTRDLLLPSCESMLTKLELHLPSLSDGEVTTLGRALTAALDRPVPPDADDPGEDLRHFGARLAALCAERTRDPGTPPEPS